MSFRLNLGFGGLCLFVPDTDVGGKPMMHVLMPNAHEHNAWLVHDLSARMGWPPTGTAEEHPLNGTVVDLMNLKTQTLLDAVPASVADLTTICNPVPRHLLDDAGPPAELTSRVTFGAGISTIDYCASGGFWEFQGVRQLPIRVVWSVDIDAGELTVVAAGGEKVTLLPHKEVLDVWLVHVHSSTIMDTFPPATRIEYPQYDQPAEHFSAYFDLLLSGHGHEPRFRKPETVKGHLPSCYDTSMPGYDLVCIAATAPSVPRARTE
jgi:hypothetical protein